MEIINAKELPVFDFNYEKIVDVIMKKILKLNSSGYKSLLIYSDNNKVFKGYSSSFVFNNFEKLSNYISKVFEEKGYTVTYHREGHSIPKSITISW